MDYDSLKLYYNRLGDEPLRPGDPRYWDIDAMEGRPRGRSWADGLARQLELSEKPLRLLVTGLRGTGKSTELLKLEQRLSRRQPEGAHHLVVLVDGEEVFDLANEIDVPDILTAVVHATERAVLEAEGKDPDLALTDGYLKRLWTWLKSTDVTLDQVRLSPVKEVTLVAEMKTRPTLRQQIRHTLTEHFSTFLQRAREELVLLNERAQKAGFARITVLFDSLEKLQGLSTNWKQVLQSAEQVFVSGDRYLHLPVHAVYTVPPALLNRSNMGTIHYLPMVKLFDRKQRRHQPGFDAMREIIGRRITDQGLSDLLGPAYEPRIDRLIERSGGHPRQMVQMLRSLLTLPELPVTEGDVQRLFAEQRERYRMVLALEDAPWLRRIHRDKTMVRENAEQGESIDRALTNSVIFRYANDDVWYGLHPAVLELEMLAENNDG